MDISKVAVGSNCAGLGERMRERLGAGSVNFDMKRFPDGDLYVRCRTDLDGETVLLVQAPFRDEGLVEHRLLQDALRSAGAETIVSFAPYVSYSRQDRSFEKGEAASAYPVLGWLKDGCDRMVVVDIHNPAILGDSGEIANMIPVLSFSRYLSGRVDVILAPDKGAMARAGMVAERMGVPCEYIRKTRIDARTVEMDVGDMDVDGKQVAIIDDIISTGGTMLKAARHLRDLGAASVAGVATHGMFSREDLERLATGLDDIAVTETLHTPVSKVDISEEAVGMLGSLL